MDLVLKSKLGQPSWSLRNRDVTFWITRTGGMLAPATFHLSDGRKVEPFAVAPWATEKLPPGLPKLLEALRGDFLCAPFGGNGTPWRGENHPPHGESANSDWTFADASIAGDLTTLHLRLATKVRRGVIDKRVTLRAGHSAIYCEHTLSGFSGPMSLGTHPCVRVPGAEGSARMSAGGWAWGEVLPVPFENPKTGGYSALKTGARFTSLTAVPLANGGTADLTRYPAREGFDDLVMLVGKPGRTLGWSAVTFPQERWVFLQLKDPAVLRHTVLWHSHGGRHYAPWNGRHRNVIGLEEATGYFHLGQAESARSNPISRAGYPTTIKLSAKKPLRVAHIFAATLIPKGFDCVADVQPVSGGVVLTSASGKIARMPLEVSFLRES